MALAVSLLGLATACETDESGHEGPGASAREDTDGPAGEGPDSGVQVEDHENWQPSYRKVRPATADDVQALRQRVVDLNETAYTVAVPPMGLEIASAPDHVRVRFGEGTPDVYDLHLDPTVATDEVSGPVAICSADGSCVDVGTAGPKGGGPHVVDNVLDSLVFTSTSIVRAQRAFPDDLDELALADASSAVVDSPSGALDCLVSGGTPDQHAQLEGSPVDLMADPVSRDEGPEPLSTMCVDPHGLVVVALPSLLPGVVPYGSFEPGVPDGFDDHADPVPYGEASQPTSPPTPTAAPTTPGTDPDTVYPVLLAAAPIPVGASPAEAQMSGRFELDHVLGDEMLPGAVASTEGLDGIALQDLAMGEQITEDSFGFPTAQDLASLGVTPALHDEIRRVAARHGYGPRAGVPPDEAAMRVLAFRFALRCAAVTSGATRWVLAASDDSRELAPGIAEATRLNEYLERTWCPKVEHN